MGILTLEKVPGLNRHFRNVRTTESSSIGFPVLSAIEAPVTLPLPGSMSTTQTPLPVMWRVRASDGYLGVGAYVGPVDKEIDIVPPREPATCGVVISAIAAIFSRFGCRGGGVVSSTCSGLISGGDGVGAGCTSGAANDGAEVGCSGVDTAPGLISSEGREAGCCSAADPPPGFSEGLVAAPPSVCFCREAISVCCCSGVDPAPGFSEGLFAAPPSIRFCREAISV